MTDNITLPRAVGLHFREVLICGKGHSPHRCHDCDYYLDEAALNALDAALAEPEKERAEVAAPARNGVASSMEEIDILTPESYRTTEPPAICSAQDNEAALERVANKVKPGQVKGLLPEAPAKPEPATDEQVAEAYKASENDESYWLDYPDGWRDAERFHGITKEDKT